MNAVAGGADSTDTNAADVGKYDAMTDFELADELASLSGKPMPGAVREIRTAPVVHDRVCGKDEMRRTVEEFLGL